MGQLSPYGRGYGVGLSDSWPGLRCAHGFWPTRFTKPVVWRVPRGPEVGPAGGPPEPILNLASVAEFTDAAGVFWRRRGGDHVDQKRLRKLLLDPAVRVLHDYLGDVTEVPSGEREAF
jgi:hypothetical protein